MDNTVRVRAPENAVKVRVTGFDTLNSHWGYGQDYEQAVRNAFAHAGVRSPALLDVVLDFDESQESGKVYLGATNNSYHQDFPIAAWKTVESIADDQRWLKLSLTEEVRAIFADTGKLP